MAGLVASISVVSGLPRCVSNPSSVTTYSQNLGVIFTQTVTHFIDGKHD